MSDGETDEDVEIKETWFLFEEKKPTKEDIMKYPQEFLDNFEKTGEYFYEKYRMYKTVIAKRYESDPNMTYFEEKDIKEKSAIRNSFEP